jgi:hypothetical protein
MTKAQQGRGLASIFDAAFGQTIDIFYVANLRDGTLDPSNCAFQYTLMLIASTQSGLPSQAVKT